MPKSDSFRVTPKAFGQNVYRLRMAKKLTQAVLADRASISRRHLQMIEAGRVNPTIAMVGKLGTIFRCSWDDLLGPLR